MSQLQKSRSVWIDEEGLGEIKKRMAELKKPEPRNPREKESWTLEELATQAHVSISTVNRLLNKKIPIDESPAISILRALGFESLDFIAKHDRKLQISKQVPRLNTVIDWQLVCQEMLQEQKEEQRFRRRATEQGFELNVYVPLGLVERKEQQRRTGILPMEQIDQLKQEVITRIYQHDEFLNDVIGQQFVGKNKHIAIVGEPGAGKTTLLDNIATYIQKNTEDLPICISLASLQGRNLKNYILEEWLPEALSLTYPVVFVETLHATSLQKLQNRLRQGGVWLLLDGVDEMGENNTLEKIQSQLTDWLGKVRVVLTCRTNVWDAKSNNPLTGFETYKTQNFSQGDVRRFIKQWFGFARKPQLGKVLREKLNEPQSDRIRQLVENPLRLALLCQVFNRDEKAELPETKAGLYELFVRYFYEWKPTLSSVDWTTQLGLKEELHQALGRLSIAGLDSDARFRLPESLIKKEFDDRLFKLAWELGWLNLVDREAKTDELVYAFFHPTFQEYFAALAIDDWHFFLNHVPENPRQGVYRIFESQWREVILLWLGQEDILKTQKHDFILSLLKFKDKCWNFYGYQALLLAALGIAEFRDCICADLIISELVWLESTTSSIGDEEDSIHGIIMTVLRVLRDTHSSILIEQLAKLRSHDDIEKFYVGSNNQEAVAALTNMLYDAKDEIEVLEIAKSLAKVNPGNQNAIDVFIKFLRNNQSSVVEIIKNSNTFQTMNKFCEQYFELIINLHKYGVKGNREIGNILIELINHLPYCWNLLLTVETVGEICITIPEVIAILTKLLQDNQEETLQRTINITLQKRFNLNSKSISLEQEEKNKFTRFVEQSIIDKMIWLYENPENMDRVQLTVAWLETIVIEQKFFFFLNSSPKGYKFIPQVSEIIAALQLMQTNCKYDIFYEKIEECLQEIVPDIVDFNLVLMNILNTWDKHIIWYLSNKNVRMCSINRNTDIDTVKHLKLILKGEFSILAKTLQHSFINSAEYSQELQQWLQGEIFHTDSLEGLNSEIEFHDWLEKWDTNYGSDIHIRYFCYSLLWQYAQNMSYPDFYDAWHKSITTHPEAPDNIQVGISSITQKLNFTQLPSVLDSAIAKDEELNKAVKLICIDGSYFSDPNNPATDIYIEMVEQGCPEKQEEPNTMQQLKKYWRLDLRKLEKRVALLFYNSKNDRTLNPSFLSDIATFGGTIAIISDEHCNNVRLISPNDPNLIDTILKWLKREISEA